MLVNLYYKIKNKKTSKDIENKNKSSAIGT